MGQAFPAGHWRRGQAASDLPRNGVSSLARTSILDLSCSLLGLAQTGQECRRKQHSRTIHRVGGISQILVGHPSAGNVFSFLSFKAISSPSRRFCKVSAPPKSCPPMQCPPASPWVHQPRHIPRGQAQPSCNLLATLLARSCSREGLGLSIWSCPQPTRIAQNTEADPYRTEADKASRSKGFQSSSPPGPPPHICTCCSFFPSIYLLKT